MLSEKSGFFDVFIRLQVQHGGHALMPPQHFNLVRGFKKRTDEKPRLDAVIVDHAFGGIQRRALHEEKAGRLAGSSH